MCGQGGREVLYLHCGVSTAVVDGASFDGFDCRRRKSLSRGVSGLCFFSHGAVLCSAVLLGRECTAYAWCWAIVGALRQRHRFTRLHTNQSTLLGCRRPRLLLLLAGYKQEFQLPFGALRPALRYQPQRQRNGTRTSLGGVHVTVHAALHALFSGLQPFKPSGASRKRQPRSPAECVAVVVLYVNTVATPLPFTGPRVCPQWAVTAVGGSCG